MKKNCTTCKHEGRDLYSTDCWNCSRCGINMWEPKEKDATQCWLELVALYDYQLRCNEGIDEEYYETKMEQFKNLLTEFRNATANEDREEIW